ncbi:MAG: AAA family ATPase [Ardenticatenaceae bacterium]|nr:AAA family ATPase [Ardenticatenaceae bacterium]
MIISGCPGTGKTSVAARMAEQSPRGVHIVSDLFYRFIAHRLLPILPESHDQNATVISAVARSVGAFAAGGYDMLVDGVIGPWFIPLVARELEPVGVAVDYVVLRAPLEVTLARAGNRQDPGAEQIVRHMHDQFAQLGTLERHAIETEGQSPDETVAEIRRRQRMGALRLELARHAG